MQLSQTLKMNVVLAIALVIPALASAQSSKWPELDSVSRELRALETPSPRNSLQLFSATLQTNAPDAASASTPHEKFATFLAGDDFKSVLLIENFRPDSAITFTPALIVRRGEVPLDPITVPAHSIVALNINAALKSHDCPDTSGLVVARYNFKTYGAATTVVEMQDEKHHLYLNSYGQSPEEYWTGTEYDGVVWAPQEDTRGFISVTNASDEMHVVQLTFLVKGRSDQQPELKVPPRQTRIVSIDGLVARSGTSGAGIHVAYSKDASEKYPGAILVEGQLFNKKTGFAKHIHFVDKDLLHPTGILRTHFLLLGRQPAEDNFPTNVSFHSVAAVRNIDTGSVKVSPVVKFLQNGVLQSVSLPPRVLAPAESSIINFNEEQKAGRLPSDFNQGSLELIPDTGHTSVVAELFNFSDTGGYVVGPSFSSYPARSTASIWRTDSAFQTTIMIENTADEDDRMAVRLYSDQGIYKKTFAVPKGGLLKINLRDLQQRAIPDDDGKVLTGTSGMLSLIGSHGTRSKLSYDKIIHDSNDSNYVGFPPNPCDFVTGILLSSDMSGNPPFAVMKEYDWSQAGADINPASGSFTSDSSLAQITNNGSGDMLTFTPPEDGQFRNVTIFPEFSQETVENCVACSSGDVNVVSFGFNIRAGVENIWYEFSAAVDPFFNRCGYTKVINCSRADGFFCGLDQLITDCHDSQGDAFQSRLEVYTYLEVQLGTRVFGGCLRLKSFSMSTSGPEVCSAIPPHLGQ